MRLFARFALCAALTFLLAPGSANAAFQLTLTPSSPTTTVGGSVGVNVYLKETVGDVLTTEKLFSAAFQLSFNSPPGIAEVASVDDITPSTAFDADLVLKSTDTSSGVAELNVVAFVNPLVEPDADNRIFLGTFTFTGLSAGTVTVTATPLVDTTIGYNVTGAFTILDPSISSGSAELRVESGGGGPAAVPAPGGLVLLCAAGATLGAFRLTRRRTRAAA